MFICSAKTRFLAAIAYQTFRSIDPNAPGAGQQDAPFNGTSSIPSFLPVRIAAASIPGYLFGAMQPRKNAYLWVS